MNMTETQKLPLRSALAQAMRIVRIGSSPYSQVSLLPASPPPANPAAPADPFG